MDAVKLKDGIKQAMFISSICNNYMQSWEPWKTAKTNPKLANSQVNILMNVFLLLCACLEPFIPTFCAKVYDIINWKRKEREEKLLGYIFESKSHLSILTIVPPKLEINEPLPIFRQSNDTLLF